MSKPTVIKLLHDINMNLGHKGLRELFARSGLDVKTLSGTNIVMCMNKRGDKLKVLGAGGTVIGYLNLEGEKIMQEALQYLPRTFGATGFDYRAACKIALYAKLPHLRQVS